MAIELRINGESHLVDSPPLTSLASVLRDRLHLTGTKSACNEGFCGSCTVLVDDEPAVACLLPIGLVGDRGVRTVESLSPGSAPLSPLQQALKDADAVQCGMCFPGILMTLTRLMEDGGGQSEAEIRQELVGNICRCTGYERIVSAAASVLNGESTTEESG